jgi:uncharacterized membrane protein YgcG
MGGWVGREGGREGEGGRVSMQSKTVCFLLLCTACAAVQPAPLYCLYRCTTYSLSPAVYREKPVAFAGRRPISRRSDCRPPPFVPVYTRTVVQQYSSPVQSVPANCPHCCTAWPALPASCLFAHEKERERKRGERERGVVRGERGFVARGFNAPLLCFDSPSLPPPSLRAAFTPTLPPSHAYARAARRRILGGDPVRRSRRRRRRRRRSRRLSGCWSRGWRSGGGGSGGNGGDGTGSRRGGGRGAGGGRGVGGGGLQSECRVIGRRSSE